MSKKIEYSNEPIEAEVIPDFLPPPAELARAKRVIKHYEPQSEEEAVAEDEVALDSSTTTVMSIPNDLVPEVRSLIARRRKGA